MTATASPRRKRQSAPAVSRARIAGSLSRAMLPSDQILEPERLIALGGDARRPQGSRPVAGLRVIEDVATTFGQDREEQIALSKLKKELAVHLGIDVHQLDGAGEPFTAFPHALDLDQPRV